MSTDKSVVMCISRKVNPTHVDPVILDRVALQKVETHEHLKACVSTLN